MFRSVRSVRTLVLWLLAFVSTGEAVECSKPSQRESIVLTDEAMLKNDFPDGSTVTFECAYGYEVVHGSDTITCTGGSWSNLELTCKKKDCGPPKPSPHLRYNMPDGTLLGALIKPICEAGYYLQGSSYRQCLPIGWSGRVECLLITCEKPNEITNGRISKGPDREFPKIEDAIEYTCHPGYTLIGNKTIWCQDDGEYNSKPPICIPIECQAPHVQFALIDDKSPYGYKSEVAVECQSGYRMEGSPKIVCEEHGWTTLPVCIKESYRATTTFTATTTSTSTRTSSKTPELIGMIPDQHPTDATESPDIVYTLVIIGIIFCVSVAVLCIVVIVRHHIKRKGSYDTGEALKTKEELLLKTSPNLTPI